MELDLMHKLLHLSYVSFLSLLQAFLLTVFWFYYDRKYSAWQKDGSFHYVHTTSFGSYSFICVDATLSPGPKRPYNFFGILNKVF